MVHEDAAAFALDALDRGDAAGFERHLATCPDCEEEIGELRFAAVALAFAAGVAAPRPGLRLRVLDTGAPVIPLHRRWRSQLLAAAAVAAACAILVAAVRPWEGGASIEGMHQYAARGAKATLLVGSSGESVLAVRHLPPLAAGTVYEVWVIVGGRSSPAGVFRGSLAALTRPVPPGATVAVSVEPAAGSPKPTGPLLLRAQTA
jgi:anti-sigma-K factor RskA